MTLDDAIKALQKAKRQEANRLLKEGRCTDKKEALSRAGGVYLYQREGSRYWGTPKVHYVGFDCEFTNVAGTYGSYRGLVLNIEEEY